MEYNFFGFKAEVDEIATHDWYTHAEEWSCDCADCCNFLVLARKRELPQPVLEILDNLGVAPKKATYVCEMYSDRDGHCYQFSYRIAGRILGGNEGPLISQDWGSIRCCHESYPHGAPDFPTPYFDLEFWLTLPWVLNES